MLRRMAQPPYVCFHDFEKAFDITELPVLYHGGGGEWKDLHGGLWKIGIPKEGFNLCYNTPLPHFQPQCGIQQGSFLSYMYAFFLLVIDQMLQRLQQSNCRANVANSFLGAAAHAKNSSPLAEENSRTS